MVELKMFNYIYLITNQINGKIYIGKHSTNKLNDRYMGSGIAVKNAIQKYGIENFSKDYLVFCDTKEQLNWLERYYIKKYNAQNSEIGYNIANGGDGGYLTEFIYIKHSEYMKEYYKTHIVWNKGKKNIYSKETLEKMSKASKQRKLTELQKQKISLSLKGHPSWSKGKTWQLDDEKKEHYKHPKHKYKWLTPDGEIIEMSKNHANRYHPNWTLLE